MEEKQIKKIIVVGDKEKVSPKLLENIKEHYGCEIEVMSREEYHAIMLKDFTALLMDDIHQLLPFELKKINNDELLLSHHEKIKQEFPKKTGKVCGKKTSSQVRQYNSRKRGR